MGKVHPQFFRRYRLLLLGRPDSTGRPRTDIKIP